MDAFNNSALVLAWIGLVCVSLLGVITLYVWFLWLWEKFLERVPFPIGLWKASKIAVQLSITKAKSDFVAHYVCEKIAEAEKENREFELSMARYLPARHNRNA